MDMEKITKGMEERKDGVKRAKQRVSESSLSSASDYYISASF